MSKRSIPIVSAIALGASAAGLAQTPIDRAFTATGTRCEDVTWSRGTLAQYPRIANACQSVTQQNGKYYVKFSGEVRKVGNRGRTLTIDFKDGDQVTLSPPENMSIHFDGRATAVRDLRRGDVLNFYVPQDQLVAEFPEGEALAVAVPIPFAQPGPSRVALVPGARMSSTAPELPKTASELPALGLFGFLLTALGAALTTLRRLHRAS
jgi:hypothetical protein